MPCKVSPIWTLVPEDEEWSDDTFVSNVFNHSYMKWRWNLRWQSRHLDGWLDKWYWYNGTSADRGLGWMLYEWQLRRDAMRPPLDSQMPVATGSVFFEVERRRDQALSRRRPST